MLCVTVLTIDKNREIRQCGDHYIYQVHQGGIVVHQEILTEEQAKIRAEVYGKSF